MGTGDVGTWRAKRTRFPHIALSSLALYSYQCANNARRRSDELQSPKQRESQEASVLLSADMSHVKSFSKMFREGLGTSGITKGCHIFFYFSMGLTLLSGYIFFPLAACKI